MTLRPFKPRSTTPHTTAGHRLTDSVAHPSGLTHIERWICAACDYVRHIVEPTNPERSYIWITCLGICHDRSIRHSREHQRIAVTTLGSRDQLSLQTVLVRLGPHESAPLRWTHELRIIA